MKSSKATGQEHDNDDEMYVVEKITEHRGTKGKDGKWKESTMQFMTKYFGYDEADWNSWGELLLSSPDLPLH